MFAQSSGAGVLAGFTPVPVPGVLSTALLSLNSNADPRLVNESMTRFSIGSMEAKHRPAGMAAAAALRRAKPPLPRWTRDVGRDDDAARLDLEDAPEVTW